MGNNSSDDQSRKQTPDGHPPANTAADTAESGPGSNAEFDGGRAVSTEPTTHTVRLELSDEPGQLLAALRPVSKNGGNLLSIYHERGNMTPRGRIPVEVDFECQDEAFDGIIGALRDEGISVIQAGTEKYGEQVTLILIGHLIDTDLSDTLQQIQTSVTASVEDVSLSSPQGTEDVSSARLRLAAKDGEAADVLATVQDLATEKGLDVIEPLSEVDP